MSMYEGIVHLRHPQAHRGDPVWNYVVLGVSFVFEAASLTIGAKQFIPTMRGRSVWRALHRSKDPSLYTVIAEDTGALAGLIIAFFGIFLGHLLDAPYLDAVASMLIGVLLAVVAVLLAYESRDLLIGESADPEIVRRIQTIVAAETLVRSAAPPLTMQLAPDEVLLNLTIEPAPSLKADEIIDLANRLERRIREECPTVRRIYIEMDKLTRPPGPAPAQKDAAP
jgi:divalent metal cation (Fe/Co/Zn/Cd) transporter